MSIVQGSVESREEQMTAEKCIVKTDGNVDTRPSNVLHDD